MSDDKAERFDAFGMPTTRIEDNPLFADTPSEEAEVEAEEAEIVLEESEAPEEPVEPEPEPAVVVEASETEEVPQASEETVEELIFGKYKDLEAAGKGYDNLRDLQRRTAERAREFEQQHTAVLAQARELEATLQQAIPYIQQLQKEKQANQGYGEYQEAAPQAPMTPEMVDLMVRSRTDEMRKQFDLERTQQEAATASQQSVYAFYEKHPEIEVEGDLDGAMYDAVRTLNESWVKSDTEVNIGDSDTLEIVYEATKNPELLTVLKMNPQYIDNDDGMQLARFQAALLKGESPITQQTQKVPASQVGQRKLPVTERASTGGAPPPQVPLNEWQEAVQELRSERNTASGSPFFE